MSVIANRMTGSTAADDGPYALHDGGMRYSPWRVVAYSWLMAAVTIGVLNLIHTGLHEHNELPPILHWIRDAALAVPFAAIAVVLAAVLVARLRPAELGEHASLLTVALWACVAAALFAVLSIPGNQLHGLLFGAEEEVGVSLIADLVGDGIYALQSALLVLAPVALLAGVPWRGAWRAANPALQPTHSSGPSQTASAGLSASLATQEPTHDGDDR